MGLAEMYLSIDEMIRFRSFRSGCKEKGWHCEVTEPNEGELPDRVHVTIHSPESIANGQLAFDGYVMLRQLVEMKMDEVIRFMGHESQRIFTHPELWPLEPTQEKENENGKEEV